MEPKDNRIQNLMFLLSAAPLSVGCVIVTDDTDTDAASTGEQQTSGSTEQTSGTTEQATSDGSGTGNDSTATGNDSTAGTGNDTTAGGTETGGEGICSTYGDFVADCQMSEEYGLEARDLCNYLSGEYYNLGGADCQAAYEEFVVCLSSLTCDEFNGKDPVCEAEDAAIDAACPAK